MLKLLIGRRCRYKQAFAITGRETAYYAGAGDGGVADGDHVLQLGLEDRVEVFGSADGDEGVGVCEGGEDADSVAALLIYRSSLEVLYHAMRVFLCAYGGVLLLVGVFKRCADSHDCSVDGFCSVAIGW